MQNRIRSPRQLAEAFPGMEITSGVSQAADHFPMAITPYYASLVRKAGRSDPVFAMAVPCEDELNDPPSLKDDPLGEDHHMVVPGLVHRYPDRALLLSTSACAMYCRHCTRKRITGQAECGFSRENLRLAAAYLSEHPEVSDVVVSGGDPFTLPTPAIEEILRALRGVPSVQVIRFGTRTPVTLPMRIDDELAAVLKRYHPVWVNTHFNHPNEITPESEAACARLADAGVPLGNQSVLLRGVNDDADVLMSLFRKLVSMRVRPYYLFSCDKVKGTSHFQTKVETGLGIMKKLRGKLGGIAIPTFVVDLPDGGGKIPMLPDYVEKQEDGVIWFRNRNGGLTEYADG